MLNYTTKSTLFQKNISKSIDDNTISVKYQGFEQISCSSDDSYYYFEYQSNVNSVTCHHCNNEATRNKGTRKTYPLIGNFNNKKVLASFSKKIFYCSHCDKHTVQSVEGIAKRGQTTKIVNKCVIEDLKSHNSTYTDVARHFGISIMSVIRIFDAYEIPAIDLRKYKSISIDELRFIKSYGNYQCIITDNEKGKVLAILPDRLKSTVLPYLTENFGHIEFVAQDLWDTYKNVALQTNNAVIICADMFHVVRTCTWSFGRGRTAYFKVPKNKAKMSWRSYNYSLSKMDALSKKITKYYLSLDPWMQRNHQAKEMFFRACRAKTKEEFNRIYKAFVRYVNKHKLVEYKSVITMVTNWHLEIINTIENNISNGICERRNSDFKQAKRNARGFGNLARSVKLVMYRINSKIGG